MSLDGHCYHCGALVDSQASILCPKCHRIEVIKIHAHDNDPLTAQDDEYIPRGTGHSLSTYEVWAFQRGVARNGLRRDRDTHNG